MYKQNIDTLFPSFVVSIVDLFIYLFFFSIPSGRFIRIMDIFPHEAGDSSAFNAQKKILKDEQTSFFLLNKKKNIAVVIFLVMVVIQKDVEGDDGGGSGGGDGGGSRAHDGVENYLVLYV